jgi:hypothetical protein
MSPWSYTEEVDAYRAPGEGVETGCLSWIAECVRRRWPSRLWVGVSGLYEVALDRVDEVGESAYESPGVVKANWVEGALGRGVSTDTVYTRSRYDRETSQLARLMCLSSLLLGQFEQVKGRPEQ